MNFSSYYDINNMQFQPNNWNTPRYQFNSAVMNNIFSNYDYLKNYSNNYGQFNFNFSNNNITQPISTNSNVIASGDSEYDAWYAKQMSSTPSEKTNDVAFLEERGKEIDKIQCMLDDTNNKIEKLKNKKSNSNTIVETSLLQEPELDENGKIKKTDNKEKGFGQKCLDWIGSAGSAIKNMGKSLIGYDKDGKWNPKKALTNLAITAVAVGATCIPIVGPAIGYGMLAYGLGSGIVGAVKGARKLNKATTEKEKEEARQEICSGVVVGGLSAWGLRGLGKAASTTTVPTKTSLLSKIGNGIKSFTTDPIKATSQAIKADISAVKSNGFFNTLGSKTTAMFTNKSLKYDDKYAEMEAKLNNQISDLNTKIASETNPAKKVLLEEHRAMIQNNLNELQNLQNLKTKVEFDNLKTKNSSTKNQESFSNYTQNSSGYEINGQTVTKENFAQFQKEMKALQKSYNKDLKNLINSKEHHMRELAKDPDAHRTELDQYTQSSIRAKYKTRKALKDGIKDINNQITDITGKISRAEEKLSTLTNPRAISNLQNHINNLKSIQTNLKNELAVCNSIKLRGIFKPFTWFQKNEYILSMGEGNATYGALGCAIKNSAKNPAVMPLYSYAQWNKDFSVPMFSSELVEMSPEQLDETIKGLEARKTQLKEGLELYNNIKTTEEWNNLKSQLAQKNAEEEKQNNNNAETPEETQEPNNINENQNDNQNK